MPRQSDVEIPLLRALVQLGGQVSADDVYRLVTEQFPNLTEDDLNERLPSGGKSGRTASVGSECD